MLYKGDFHIHSTASDGEFSPEEIVLTAKRREIDLIAITDHNTVKGLDEVVSAGRKHGISVVPAVEMSTKYKGEKIHILGYFRDILYQDSNFQEILSYIKNHRAGKIRKILKSPFSEASSGDYLSTIEGIQLLRLFNAAVVLAHPVRIKGDIVHELFKLPFDGIEAKYCLNNHNETNYFINIALRNFSFYTGGSDFHTYYRKENEHCIIGEPYLNASEIQAFLKSSNALLYSSNNIY